MRSGRMAAAGRWLGAVAAAAWLGGCAVVAGLEDHGLAPEAVEKAPEPGGTDAGPDVSADADAAYEADAPPFDGGPPDAPPEGPPDGPTGCASSAECGGGVCCTANVCASSMGTCVPSCTSGCPGGFHCCATPDPPECAGMCVPDCLQVPNACNADQVCDPATHLCLGKCPGAPCPPNHPTCDADAGVCH